MISNDHVAVKFQWTGTGTGNVVSAGAVTGFRTPPAVLNAVAVSYTIINEAAVNELEMGVAIWDDASQTLLRAAGTAVYPVAGKVSFGSGTKRVSFTLLPADFGLLAGLDELPLADLVDASTDAVVIGRAISTGAGVFGELDQTALRNIIGTFSASARGLVPASTIADGTKSLFDDGVWRVATGGGSTRFDGFDDVPGDYTLTDADHNRLKRMTGSAGTQVLVLPLDATEQITVGSVFTCRRDGNAIAGFAAEIGVNIDRRPSDRGTDCRVAGSTIMAIKEAANTYWLAGDLGTSVLPPPFSFTPADFTGVTMYCDAAAETEGVGNPVATFDDQIGANNFTAAAGEQPTLIEPVVGQFFLDFATPDRMTGAAFSGGLVSSPTNWFVAAVVAWDALAAPGTDQFEAPSAWNLEGRNLVLGADTGGLYLAHWDGAGTVITTTAPTIGQVYAISCWHDGSDLYLRIGNGATPTILSTPETNAVNLPTGPLWLGGAIGASPFSLTGKIGMIATCSTKPPDSEITDFETWAQNEKSAA